MNEPMIPRGMTVVTQKQFFALLKKDPRDIMPSHRDPNFTTWETDMRSVWGWTLPGWKDPMAERVYAVWKT